MTVAISHGAARKAVASKEELPVHGGKAKLDPVCEHQLDEIETEPLDSLETAAWTQLERVLAEASRLTFYNKRFSWAGVDSGSIDGFDDFAARIPIFRKVDLIEEFKRRGTYTAGLEAIGDGGTANVVLTSGTTGFPTFALLGVGEFEHGSPREVLREFWMDGMRPGMRVMCQYPSWHHLSMLDARALEWMGAKCLIPWGTFTPRFVGRALDLITSQEPEYLLTTTTMLHAIVDECDRRVLDPAKAFSSMRYAMVVGEPVSPEQRQLLVELLGLEDLFERGGSSDGLWGGADCPAHAGHHVWLDNHYVEVVDPVTGQPLGPGERGSVVVTNLTLDRSLFIRFDTEDLGEILPGLCPCGRTHPRVELYGRLADCVRIGDRMIAPYDVRMRLDQIPELVGVPFVVVREADRMDVLRVRLDGDARRKGLAEAATGHLVRTLELPIDVGWAESLPKRWKARMAVES